MRRRYLLGTLTCLVIGVVLLAGCNEEKQVQPSSENIKIEIKTGADDGGVVALTDLLPDNVFGIVNGGGDQPFMVGLLASGGGDNLTGRGIYRFDISEYKNKSFTFHVKCVEKHGNPGSLEVYLTNDSGPLETNPSNMSDISQIWNLINFGEKVATITPASGGWITVSISLAMVKSWVTDDGYITIMLKLGNENLGSNNDCYSFSTYEYSQGSAKPYLSAS